MYPKVSGLSELGSALTENAESNWVSPETFGYLYILKIRYNASNNRLDFDELDGANVFIR